MTATKHVFDKVESILHNSVNVYELIYLSDETKDEDGECDTCIHSNYGNVHKTLCLFSSSSSSFSEMDTDGISGADSDSRHYWDSYQNLAQLMHSLGLLECFTTHAITVVVQEEVICNVHLIGSNINFMECLYQVDEYLHDK